MRMSLASVFKFPRFGRAKGLTRSPKDPFIISLRAHRLQYQPGGKTLIVSFDHATRPSEEAYEGRETWGAKFYLAQGHSLLGVIAKTADWYRNKEVIEALVSLRDSGFFASFDQVVMTGGSMGGFAAAAFAPLAPGSTVISLSPQSTLNPKLVPWETRFANGRKQDWSLPYGDAAEGLKHAKKCYVVYDSLDSLDVRQAARFGHADHVTHLRIPCGGHGVSPVLNQMGVLQETTSAMIDGTMTAEAFRVTARLRRNTPRYGRVLANAALTRKHYRAALRVCERTLQHFPNADVQDLKRLALTAMGLPDQSATFAQPKSSNEAENIMQTPEIHRFDDHFPNLKGNIFVVTYGRTGSTLLQNLLMTIPGCTIRGENHNVMEGIWNAAIRGRMAKNVWGEIEQPASHPWYGSDQMKPLLFGRSLVDAFVHQILSPPENCRYFGFKEIRYNAFGDRLPEVLDFMNFHFKNAFFVFNKRNVEDVSKSAWWKNWNPDDVNALVQNMDRRFAEYHAAHPANTAVLAYEDFSRKPESLRPLFEKLGEPFDLEKLKAVLQNRLQH